MLTEPSQSLVDETAQRMVGTTDVWMTVLTARPWVLVVPSGLRVELDHEVLMTRPLERSEGGARSVEHGVDGPRLHVSLRQDDVEAAGGWVAVVGAHATFDRIETHREHRRRGLGSDVMVALEAWALQQGARRGPGGVARGSGALRAARLGRRGEHDHPRRRRADDHHPIGRSSGSAAWRCLS
ncbi:hypothetical protein NPS01_15540 [Nocardioides psychrotolerans]|uniref:GNAT family N-acetyltransferase n=1 Tax=Nocardioides psychrotolerans TaxID=1005945 RepID=UPI000B819A71|nr:GNAT family N-acetyltransferase [Nocardioides psychrotolerans]GEP37891.1 hypothetical protein NPS01_15540 [Nocardioides psychrotolerans]